MNIDDLDEKFGVEGEIGFAELEEDMVFAMISNKNADANICLYGAHITTFTPRGTTDVLWMSHESLFQEGSAIRGGIPICFPWFGPHETDKKLPQHGFARLMNWDVVETKSLPNGESLITLQLCSSEETKEFWPNDFCAEITFIVGLTLSVSLKIKNTGAAALEYSSALHSYFNLSAIENIAIAGLQNTRYQNQLDSGDYIQEEQLLTIKKAETRHYYNTESDSIIIDPFFNRKIRIEKSGSKNTTVWNPWEETCTQMNDMPDDGFHTFICVETVNKIDNSIKLAPEEEHETSAIISVER